MKYYTRKGDDGYTGILGEGRLPKNHPRLETLGTIDEASAAIGLARSLCQSKITADLLMLIQKDLYGMMAEVAGTKENVERFRVINAEKVTWVEDQTDKLSKLVQLPAEFIISGNSPAGAAMNLARTIVRRAERHIADIVHQGEMENIEILRYINRLSSLCFILEGVENNAAGKDLFTLAKE